MIFLDAFFGAEIETVWQGGEILNEKVDCDNCSKYRGYFGMYRCDIYKIAKAKRRTE